MFAIGIDLLMRRAIISQWGNREEPEWPPHPDRIFMALVAAWGERGEDATERQLLEWLETLSSPAMNVPFNGSRRTVFTTYVPANDSDVPMLRGKAPTTGQIESGIKVLPEHRGKNARLFPAVIPADSTFYLIWENVQIPSASMTGLNTLCNAVTYLGHSATPVRMWIESKPPSPNLVPVNIDGQFIFRSFGPGRIEYLKQRYDAGLRPLPTNWQSYSRKSDSNESDVQNGPFDPGIIILRQIEGRRFPLESSGLVATAVRNTLMSRFGQNPPEWLSGHADDETPSKIRRPAYIPLSYVGSEYADGHILGVAIAIPPELTSDQIDVLYQLLGRHDGSKSHDIEAGVPSLGLVIRNSALNRDIGNLDLALDETGDKNLIVNLRPSNWVKPSRTWGTVTPIMLPRFPRRSLTSEAVVTMACVDAGYPEPLEVATSLSPLIRGVPHARSFQIGPRAGRAPRPLIHAIIEFANPLRGPVIIGAGRYSGFGVCRPFESESPK